MGVLRRRRSRRGRGDRGIKSISGQQGRRCDLAHNHSMPFQNAVLPAPLNLYAPQWRKCALEDGSKA